MAHDRYYAEIFMFTFICACVHGRIQTLNLTEALCTKI